MSAQPHTEWDTVPWSPDPWRQRLGNHTVEDVVNLPSDAPRVELRDGVMFVVPSPTFGHQDIMASLWSWFRSHAPTEWRPAIETGVMIAADQTLEPDVLLVRRDDVSGGLHFAPAQSVLLVVEVVSKSTRRRDRLEKPALYADAGIPYFWRIEQEPRLTVFAYRLGASGTYELAAEATDILKLAEPFPIELAIAEIAP